MGTLTFVQPDGDDPKAIVGRLEVMELPFAVLFLKPERDNVAFSFDWIDFKTNDENKKISFEHHGLKNDKVTHLLNKTTGVYDNIEKDEKREEKWGEALLSSFPIVNKSSDDPQLHVPVSYLAVAQNNTGDSRNINIEMQVRTQNKKMKQYPPTACFNVPKGMTIKWKDGPTITPENGYAGYQIKENTIKMTLQIGQCEEGEQKLEVLDINCNVVGRLVIYNYAPIEIPVNIWPLVDVTGNLGTKKTGNSVNSLILKKKALDKLQEKLDELYLPIGIKLKPRYPNAPADGSGAESGYLTFDLQKPPFVQYRSGGNEIIPDGGKVNGFFSEIQELLKLNPNGFSYVKTCGDFKYKGDGINLIIVDKDTKEETTSNSSSAPQTVWNGLGNVGGGDLVLLFKRAKNLYGVYAHEIGHYFGLCHSFLGKDKDGNYKTNESANSVIEEKWRAVVEKKKNHISNNCHKEWEQYKIDNPNEKNLFDTEYGKFYNLINSDQVKAKETAKYNAWEVQARCYDSLNLSQHDPEVIQANNNYLGVKANSEPVLYAEKKTENVMDYAEQLDFFFSWQWRMIRYTAKRLGYKETTT